MDSRLIILFVAFISVERVESLKCYSCTYMAYYSSDSALEDDLNSELAGYFDPECELGGEKYREDSRATSIECSASDNVCYKVDYDIEAEYMGTTLGYYGYERGCEYADGVGCRDFYDDMTQGADQSVSGEATGCACDEDNCNTASSLSAGLVAVFLSALSGIWMK